MQSEIAFTLINSAQPLNKHYDSDGSKTSRGTMNSGIAKKYTISSIKTLFDGFPELPKNQAITLGVTEHTVCEIVTKGQLNKSGNAENTVARTKEYFSFNETSFLLLDYDPSENGFEIKSPEHYCEVLREIDPELTYCDIGVTYGSSYGIYKDGALLSDKKSLHAYIIVCNASDERVKQYKDYLVEQAWIKGYGHIELSKTGSVLRRQVFDDAVFSAERLIFEAKPTLAEGITRITPETYISKGADR